MKNSIKKLLKNPVAKLICLVIAIFLWFYVMDYLNPETTRVFKDVEVNIDGADQLTKDGLIVLQHDPIKVDVEVKGFWKDIMRYEREKLDVTTYISGYDVGEADVAIRAYTNDSRVSIKSTSSNVVHFTFDRIATVDKGVKIVTDGELPSGFELGNLEELSKSVEIRGPSTITKNVAYLEALVDINQKKQSFNAHVELKPMDTQGEPIESEEIEILKPIFDFKVPILSVKEVPINIQIDSKLDNEHIISSSSTNPKTIKIEGDTSVIGSIESVQTEPVTISSNDSFEQEVNLVPIEGVSFEVPHPIKANFKIEAVESRIFSFSSKEIELKEKSNTLKYTFINSEELYNIEFRGVRSQLTDLKKDQIKLDINVKGITSGTYKLPINVTTDIGITYSVDPKNIEIEVSN